MDFSQQFGGIPRRGNGCRATNTVQPCLEEWHVFGAFELSRSAATAVFSIRVALKIRTCASQSPSGPKKHSSCSKTEVSPGYPGHKGGTHISTLIARRLSLCGPGGGKPSVPPSDVSVANYGFLGWRRNHGCPGQFGETWDGRPKPLLG